MKIRAQIGMVLNLDKCIGCHTCSVTCKNVWTSRPGVEYAWFNNVETKPGIGYPREWENQADRKSTRLNSSHLVISYAVFCLKKKKSLHTRPDMLRYPAR